MTYANYTSKENKIPIIEAIDGQLITNCIWSTPKIIEGNLVSDTDNDILKIVVYNRYYTAAPKVGFIKNFGFKNVSNTDV